MLRLDVVALADGRSLGPPARILIDPDRHEVAAVVMVLNPIRELSVYFRPSAVVSFDSDSLAIEGLTHLRVAANDEFVLGLLGRAGIRDRAVLSSQGQALGTITDAVLGETGDVLEYWIKRERFGSLRPRLKVRPDALTAPPGQLAVVDHDSLAGDDEPPATPSEDSIPVE